MTQSITKFMSPHTSPTFQDKYSAELMVHLRTGKTSPMTHNNHLQNNSPSPNALVTFSTKDISAPPVTSNSSSNTSSGSPTHSISSPSPPSVTPEDNAMSPSLDQQQQQQHENGATFIVNTNNNNNSQFLQQHFISRNGSGAYTSSPPPKNSFCIDALLSKNQTDQPPGNVTHHHQNLHPHRSSPEVNRFMSEEDAFRKYSDDREYTTPSPDETTSRYAI